MPIRFNASYITLEEVLTFHFSLERHGMIKCNSVYKDTILNMD